MFRREREIVAELTPLCCGLADPKHSYQLTLDDEAVGAGQEDVLEELDW